MVKMATFMLYIPQFKNCNKIILPCVSPQKAFTLLRNVFTLSSY